MLLFFSLFAQSFASIEIISDDQEVQNLIEIKDGVVQIYGDVILWHYYSVWYPLEIFGDLQTDSHVTFKKDVIVHGNADLGNYTKVFQTLIADEISTGLRVEVSKLQADYVQLWWENKVLKWLNINQDFEAGSDLVLQWNSFIGGNFKVLKDAKISWNLFILWNATGHFDFEFNGKKMVVRGQFRTLEDSFLKGRIYMFAGQWHKYKYGNKLWKYKYNFSKLIYKDFFWKVDPFLQYDLQDQQITQIRAEIKQFDNEIEKLQEEYINNYSKLSVGQKYALQKKLEQYLNKKFQYISPFIWKNNWQQTEFKKLKYLQENELKRFISQVSY